LSVHPATSPIVTGSGARTRRRRTGRPRDVDIDDSSEIRTNSASST
jgi:hypothetical protein